MPRDAPRLVVFSTLFPHPGQPNGGLFIRERMFRVGQVLPLTVVAPVPWFPLQGLIRRWRPHFRPRAPRREVQDGVEVLHPRFFSVPGAFKWLDGLLLALGSLPAMLRVRRRFGCDLIDAHFAYPDGYAATLLGKWLKVPVTITLRGTEVPLARDPARRRRMVKALQAAARVFSVSASLKRHAVAMGIDESRIRVVGNGVDTAKFHRMPREEARRSLGLPPDAPVMVSVGALVERKGFHRVIECLPALRRRFPGLRYLVVGGPGPEGNREDALRRQVAQSGLEDVVLFLGTMPPEQLRLPLSAADLFVLATRNEGWANVFLEAMACGLPVVTTDVGGNAEVVSGPELGAVVPFGDQRALREAIARALAADWDREAIVAHARANSWDDRVGVLVEEFTRLHEQAAPAGGKAKETDLVRSR